MLQVAAATNCKHHYGVEKADIPAKYAEVSASGPWARLHLSLFFPTLVCGGLWGEGVACARGQGEGSSPSTVGSADVTLAPASAWGAAGSGESTRLSGVIPTGTCLELWFARPLTRVPCGWEPLPGTPERAGEGRKGAWGAVGALPAAWFLTGCLVRLPCRPWTESSGSG